MSNAVLFIVLRGELHFDIIKQHDITKRLGHSPVSLSCTNSSD